MLGYPANSNLNIQGWGGLPKGLEFLHESVFAYGEPVPDIPLPYGDTMEGDEAWWWEVELERYQESKKPTDDRVEKYLRESTLEESEANDN